MKESYLNIDDITNSLKINEDTLMKMDKRRESFLSLLE